MRRWVYSLVVLAIAATRAGASTVAVSDAVAMAKPAAAMIEAKGEVPEQMDVPFPRGGGVRMKAQGALLFFCAVLSQCHEKGQASGYVDLPNGSTRLRRTPRAEASRTQGEVARVDTPVLVRQCRSLPALVKRTGGLPSAVWVGDKRLCNAQFFGAVLNALSAFKDAHKLSEQAVVPRWKGPPSWPACQTFDPAEAARQAEKNAAKLIIIKPDGSSPVSGSVSVTVTYGGKLDYMEVSLDAKRKWIGNSSPFGFIWKTEEAANGEHKLTVRAVDKDGRDLRVEKIFTVNNPL